MKKNMVFGMAAMMALTMASVQPVFAAAGKPVEAYRQRMERTEIGKGQIKSVNDQSAATARQSVAKALEGISKDAASNEILSAVSRTLDLGSNKFNETAGSKVTIESVARTIAKKAEQLKEENRNNMDAATKIQHEMTERAVKASAAFIGLAAKTSRVDSTLDAATTRRLEAFEKQIALIPEILKMNAADMETHVKVMEKAIEMKISPETRGDVAFENAVKEIYKGNAAKKLAELLGCKV